MLDKPHGQNIVARLYDGAWIGVMEDQGDWLRVITSDGYGWIKSVQTREGSGFQLRTLPGISEKQMPAV